MELPSRRTFAVGSVVALGALVLTTGPLYRVRTWWAFSDPLAADVAVVAVQVLVGAVAIVALATDGRWRRVDPRMGVVALALVAWMAFGALWSPDASTTLRESLMVGVTLAAGMGAAAAVTERTLVVGSWIGIQLGLAWSAVVIVTVQPGSQDRGGEFAGVYFNPNSLALVAAVGIFLSFVAALQLARHQHRWIAFGVLTAAIVADLWLIIGAGALTPLVGLVVGLAVAGSAILGRRIVGPVGRWPTDAGRVSAVVGVGLVAVATVAWATRSSWLSAVGRSSTLTGRTEAWDVAIDWFWKQPIVGQGYLGAWFDPEFAAAQLAARGEVLGSTHNSFVELLLGAGIVGFGLAVALFALAWIAAGRRALTGVGLLAAWPLAALVFVIMENLAETLWVGGQLAVAMLGAIVVVSTSQSSSGPPPEPSSAGATIDSEVDVVGVERGR
ncbi:MAG TPA: O-antigen ligase family protein [Ilumatobacteraceae bacterium]|nr:O-antigen ligase family protein [Ilumatobacteraceae bacterium]